MTLIGILTTPRWLLSIRLGSVWFPLMETKTAVNEKNNESVNEN